MLIRSEGNRSGCDICRFVVVVIFVFNINIGLEQHFEESFEIGGEPFETDRQVQELDHATIRVVGIQAVIITISGFTNDKAANRP
jgi:hypothetical protein